MKENLSALIDGELHGETPEPHFSRLKHDAELRRAWDTWHLIGDALRGELGAEVSGRVAARLAQEPTVLAPRRENQSPMRAAWVAIAAAAGVAAVALVTWTALPVPRPEAPQLAAAPAAGKAATQVAEPSQAEGAAVYEYLLAHQPYSHTSAMQGLAPYARTVAEERGAR